MKFLRPDKSANWVVIETDESSEASVEDARHPLASASKKTQSKGTVRNMREPNMITVLQVLYTKEALNCIFETNH
jgi:hypothetical protein